MSFKETVSLCLICLAFSMSAQAADLPEHPRPRPRPEEPSPDYPSQPPEAPRREPRRQPRCQDNCQPAYNIPRTVYVNTIVSNTYLDLVQIMNLGGDVAGYEVVSVEVQVQGGVGGSQLTLWANGQVQGAVFNPFGSVSLAPQYPFVLNCQPSFMMLEVRGAINVGAITVYLRPAQYNNSGYGQTVQMP